MIAPRGVTCDGEHGRTRRQAGLARDRDVGANALAPAAARLLPFGKLDDLLGGENRRAKEKRERNAKMHGMRPKRRASGG